LAGVTFRRTRRILKEVAKSPVDQFLAWCAATPLEVVNSAFAEQVRDAFVVPDASSVLRTGGNDVDTCLDRDLSVYLPNHNLLYTDKMGMAVGVETRVPLLDMNLVSLATSFPAKWKLRPTTKGILREAARGIVPDAIIDRPKAGFGAPFRHWLRHELVDLWNDVSCERSVNARGWFDHRALANIRAQSQSGRADFYMLQWAVLTTELWARRFLDENPATTSRPVTEPHTVTLPAAA
jgi:asparagine synthase (glutamine-hydrolysing)